MITRLLLSSSILFVLSCTSTPDSSKDLSNEEMKNRIEAEEIEFDTVSDIDENEVHTTPSKAAQFNGGQEELKEYIDSATTSSNFYQQEGTVLVSFIVEKNGDLSNVKIAEGQSEELDQEALALVRTMPKWIPAKNNGKVVAARVRLPIRFSLN